MLLCLEVWKTSKCHTFSFLILSLDTLFHYPIVHFALPKKKWKVQSVSDVANLTLLILLYLSHLLPRETQVRLFNPHSVQCLSKGIQIQGLCFSTFWAPVLVPKAHSGGILSFYILMFHLLIEEVWITCGVNAVTVLPWGKMCLEFIKMTYSFLLERLESFRELEDWKRNLIQNVEQKRNRSFCGWVEIHRLLNRQRD